MTDIVERLRSADISGHGSYSALVRDAADEIERLWQALNEIEALAYKRTEVVLDQIRRTADEALSLRRDRPRDDGTVVAVGGEPGASAGKSE